MTRFRTVHDIATGLISQIEVDDAWILANRPSTILLTASSLNVAVNGIITLSAQLQTPVLADDTQDNLSENRAIQLRLGDLLTTVNLVNGFWTDNAVSFVLAGSYELTCIDSDLASNILTVVVN